MSCASPAHKPRLVVVLHAACPLVLALVVFLCFSPILRNEFVNWDDVQSFEENPNCRGVSLRHLRWMFTTVYLGHYQPLSWVTHALVYSVSGLDPTGYHLLNLLLHMSNTIVFYFIIAALLRQQRSGATGEVLLPAAVGALFFAIHPLRVEPVAWATERREVLATFFLLLSVLAYLRTQSLPDAVGRARTKWFVISLGCYALSLLSKASGMTLIVVLLALDVYPLRRFADAEGKPVSRTWVLAEKVPYVAPAFGAAAVALLAQSRHAALALGEHGLLARAMQAMYGLVFYLWKTVLPAHLSPLYLLPTPLDPSAPRYIASAAVVVAVTVALVHLRRCYPWGLVAWLSYVALVAPVLGIVQSGPQITADRYSYLACLPFAVLVAAGTWQLQDAWHAGLVRPLAHYGVITIILAALGVLGVLTYRQTRVWRNSLALWDHVLAIEPMNYVAYNNRAEARQDTGDVDGALADANEALRLNPDYGLAYLNRGKVRMRKGDGAGALADFDQSIRLTPTYANAYVARGNARQAAADIVGALADFTMALQLDPQFAEAYYNRGNAHKVAGDPAAAIADYSAALAIEPGNARAYNNRGTALREQGNLDAALADYDQALRVNPRYTLAYISRAGARSAKGDRDGAIADYAQALQLTPPGDASRDILERRLAALRRVPTQ